VEVISALYARHRGGALSARSLATAIELHEDERRWWTLIASALFFQEAMGTGVPFLTSDARQRSIAEAAGLRVWWV